MTNTGNVTLMAVTPTRMYTALSTILAGGTTCGVAPGGSVECWGQNDRGQTGSAVFMTTLTAAAVTGLTGCTAVAVGREHACALCGGSIQCWGANRLAELGAGN